jgi:hypothetical protein
MENSPIFGLSWPLSRIEDNLLRNLVEQSPVAVFQYLNMKLNTRGYCISISTLEEHDEEHS